MDYKKAGKKMQQMYGTQTLNKCMMKQHKKQKYNAELDECRLTEVCNAIYMRLKERGQSYLLV
jgi:hypothetical protein